MWYTILLFLHLLFATIWVGGHLVLSIGILPQAIKTKDVSIIVNFESIYEKIGIPSLVGQILTGIILFLMRVENYSVLLRWDDFIGRHFILKILLLLFTIGLAIHARLRIVPKLNKENLNILAIHIIAVSIVGVLFVLVGISIRLGIF
jgi:putative copper export protein